ncbi:MAG: FkbM family methyltransferase [Alphaproteobacteria bacterium]|nr:FkbM family methyltransferase [Alphaproteobacteria bacterium]
MATNTGSGDKTVSARPKAGKTIASKAATSKTTASKTAASKTTARKTTGKTTTGKPAASKTTTGKTAASKTAASKRAATKTSAGKTSAAAKPASKQKAPAAPKVEAAPFPHQLLRDIYNADGTTRRVKRRIRASLPPAEVDYRGVKMIVHPADNNTEFQIWRMGRSHEERALRTILTHLRDAPFLAFDVGANAGSFCLRLAAQAPKGSAVHAFEPNPEMQARLQTNIALNGFTSIDLHGCAISDEEGEIELFVPANGNLGQARIMEGFDNANRIEVPARRLSGFVPKTLNQRIDFLKVDIEGFEDRAILPLLTDLDPALWPRLIFFEHKHSPLWAADVPAEITARGYRLMREFGRNALYGIDV